MATARTPRSDWTRAAMRALASGGPDAVRVESLAKDLGVTKGGFYWHFEDRAALLVETLDAWEETGTEEVIATVERGSDDPRERLRRLFAMSRGAKGLFAVELALRDWARRDRTVARRLRRVDDRRLTFLRGLFAEFCADAEEAEARAMLAYSLFVGSYFIVAGHGERSRGEVQRLAVDHLLG